MSDDTLELAGYAMVIGPTLLGWGFAALRRKRLMENTPTSLVRSAAMGLVELKGVAQPRQEITAPMSGRASCWWRLEIQEWRKSGKSSKWVTIREAVSPGFFYLEDATGRVLVDPAGAEFNVPAVATPLDASNRAALSGALASRGVAAAGFFGPARQIRFLEQNIMPLTPLYVLGELGHLQDQLSARRQNYLARVKALKEDKEAMRRADADGDGAVSPEEWEKVRQKMEEEWLKEEAGRPVSVEEKLILRRSPHQDLFVCAGTEEDYLKTQGLTIFLKLAGGVALFGFGLWLAQTEGLPAVWAVAMAAGGLALGLVIGFKKSKRRLGRLWL